MQQYYNVQVFRKDGGVLSDNNEVFDCNMLTEDASMAKDAALNNVNVKKLDDNPEDLVFKVTLCEGFWGHPLWK